MDRPVGDVVGVYRRDVTNIGDMASYAGQYIPWLKGISEYDVETDNLITLDQEQTAVVVGGGGLFGQPGFKPSLDYLALSNFRALVAWGVGFNANGSRQANFPASVERFDLFGRRDKDGPAGTQWVPCVSCLNPALDNDPSPIHDVVVLEHMNHRIEVEDPGLPRMLNTDGTGDEMIQFIGSGSALLTNSYHAAYWATLLGRKVVVVSPFSSKFFTMKHQPVIADADGWRSALNSAPVYEEAMSESRDANKQFGQGVKDLLQERFVSLDGNTLV